MSLLKAYIEQFLHTPTPVRYSYIKANLSTFLGAATDQYSKKNLKYITYLIDDYYDNKNDTQEIDREPLKNTILSELELLGQSPEDKFVQLFKQLGTLSQQNKWGDPFSYARSREIMASIKLGHDICGTYSGADAFTKCELKKPIEYKSTIGEKIKGAYTGISVFPTWSEQYKYLETKKIGKYLHFYNRFSNHELAESWTVPTNKVLEILSTKLRKNFNEDGLLKPSHLKKKAPRLSSSMTANEIINNGVRVI